MTKGLSALAGLCAELAAIEDLDGLIDAALPAVRRHLGFDHAMILLIEPDGQRLTTFASLGYPEGGVGSEVRVGVGLAGIVAQRRTPMYLANLGTAMRYARATRNEVERWGDRDALSKVIPLPGLDSVNSQMAVPMIARGELVGVLCVESEVVSSFDAEDQSTLTVVGHQIAASITLVHQSESVEEDEVVSATTPRRDSGGSRVEVRYYQSDNSVFVDGEYLIKSLPGRILWRLLSHYDERGRTEFTNRELRLDSALGLPPVKDNLETRLILLRRRLAERSEVFRLDKAGRGRMRLTVSAPFELVEVLE